MASKKRKRKVKQQTTRMKWSEQTNRTTDWQLTAWLIVVGWHIIPAEKLNNLLGSTFERSSSLYS